MTVPSIGELPDYYFSGGARLTDGDLAEVLNNLGRATRIVHEPIASSNRSRSTPGAGPSPLAIGPVLTLEYSSPSDALYSEFRVPSTHDGAYAALHIHWTKSSDAVEAGNTVRWQLELLQFSGAGPDNDLTATPITMTVDDTYDDAGTTSRIVYRTDDVVIPGGVTAGYYFGLRVTVVGASTTLTGNPALVSADFRVSKEINR